MFVLHKSIDIPEDTRPRRHQRSSEHLRGPAGPQEDADWAARTFGFEPSTANVLQTLAPGQFIFTFGSGPETHVEHVRSSIEVGVTAPMRGCRGIVAGVVVVMFVCLFGLTFLLSPVQ